MKKSILSTIASILVVSAVQATPVISEGDLIQPSQIQNTAAALKCDGSIVLDFNEAIKIRDVEDQLDYLIKIINHQNRNPNRTTLTIQEIKDINQIILKNTVLIKGYYYPCLSE